jgi:hypothetical protein
VIDAPPQIIRRDPAIPEHVRNWRPKSRLGLSIFRALPHLPPDLAAELVDRISSAMVYEARLSIRVLRGYGLYLARLIPREEVIVEDYGIVSRRVMTDTGMGFVVDAFQNLTEFEVMKYHGIGTGSTAEAATETALVTELTTEYNPDNTRATGSTTETSQKVLKSVGTNTLDAAPAAALREHSLFSQAATGGGVMFDRSLYAAITLSSGDALESTYEGTFNSGG